jgi:hypothetical protein
LTPIEGDVHDAMGRRIGKVRNGQLVKGWLYADGLRPIAQLNAAGQLEATYVYGSRGNVPDLIVENNGSSPVTYRLVADQLADGRGDNTCDAFRARRCAGTWGAGPHARARRPEQKVRDARGDGPGAAKRTAGGARPARADRNRGGSVGVLAVQLRSLLSSDEQSRRRAGRWRPRQSVRLARTHGARGGG